MNRARNNMNGSGTFGNMNGMNGANGMNGSYGYNGSDRSSNGRGKNGNAENALLEEIRALAFVKTELELYLNTHPNCRTALDYYQQTIAALERLTEEYHNTVGPLVASGVVSGDEWTWANAPWPWHRDVDVDNGLWKGEGR